MRQDPLLYFRHLPKQKVRHGMLRCTPTHPGAAADLGQGLAVLRGSKVGGHRQALAGQGGEVIGARSILLRDKPPQVHLLARQPQARLPALRQPAAASMQHAPHDRHCPAPKEPALLHVTTSAPWPEAWSTTPCYGTYEPVHGEGAP